MRLIFRLVSVVISSGFILMPTSSFSRGSCKTLEQTLRLERAEFDIQTSVMLQEANPCPGFFMGIVFKACNESYIPLAFSVAGCDVWELYEQMINHDPRCGQLNMNDWMLQAEKVSQAQSEYKECLGLTPSESDSK